MHWRDYCMSQKEKLKQATKFLCFPRAVHFLFQFVVQTVSSHTCLDFRSYTVHRCSDDVCYLRLDFETFTLQGIGGTAVANEGTCLDQFAVTTQTSQVVPTICGSNAGQHSKRRRCFEPVFQL